jgi:uncharacterized protein YbjT (DUF2867 family)
MKIVVIGGTGLIGSKTVAILRQRSQCLRSLAQYRCQHDHWRGP